MEKKLENISHLLAGVDSDNKLAVAWYNTKCWIRYAIPYQIREYYRKYIATIFKPQHKRIRKSIPRYWMDLDYIIEQTNFEVIKSFYEDEYKNGIVDWEESGKEAKKFVKWLEKAYNYIVVERPDLEAKMNNAYPIDDCRTKSYEELYGEVDRYEKLIEETDTKVLIDLIKYRKYMWT